MYGKSRSAISRMLKPGNAASIIRKAWENGEEVGDVGELLAKIEAKGQKPRSSAPEASSRESKVANPWGLVT
eukprot:545385-Hanusia_phi.AAC.1